MLDIKKLQIHNLLNVEKYQVKLRELDFWICYQESFNLNNIWCFLQESFNLNNIWCFLQALSLFTSQFDLEPCVCEWDLITLFCFVYVYLSHTNA